MTPAQGHGFAARCAELCPGFEPGELVRTRKSELLAGRLGGEPVIAKRLVRDDPVWRWYFAREVAIYRAFAAVGPPPLRVPRVHAAADDVIVVERFTEMIARRRRPAAELPREQVERLIAAHAAIARWPGHFPADPPTPRVRGQLRARLLEDPTAPLEWVCEGIETARVRGLFDADLRDRARAALAGHAPIAASHGDLLLRNAFVIDGGEVALVDWECAGHHVADWDLALLWTQLGPAARGVVECVVEPSSSRHRAFLALVAFALAREVAFLRAFRVAPGHRGLAPARAELQEVADALARAI
jgi:hypothetical protein